MKAVIRLFISLVSDLPLNAWRNMYIELDKFVVTGEDQHSTCATQNVGIFLLFFNFLAYSCWSYQYDHTYTFHWPWSSLVQSVQESTQRQGEMQRAPSYCHPPPQVRIIRSTMLSFLSLTNKINLYNFKVPPRHPQISTDPRPPTLSYILQWRI